MRVVTLYVTMWITVFSLAKEILGEPPPYSSKTIDYIIQEKSARAKNHRYYDEPYRDVLLDYNLPFKLRAFYAIHGRNSSHKGHHYTDEENFLNKEQKESNIPTEHPTEYVREFIDDEPKLESKMDDYLETIPSTLKNRKVSKKCNSCRCGVQRKSRGSRLARQNEFPWLAMLAYFGRFYCSGSLVNNLYVVSAGHCTRGYQTAKITVRLLEYERSTSHESPDIIRRVARIFRPKGYSENSLNNDISLLRLATSVPVHDGFIRPICLPLPQTSFGGQDGILASWSNSLHDKPTSMIRKTVVPIIRNKRCRNTEHGDSVTDKMLCARSSINEGMDTCFGDSGGPLMTMKGGRYRLAGIISWVNGCGKRDFPSIYTRVTKFSLWIRKFSTGACWCT